MSHQPSAVELTFWVIEEVLAQISFSVAKHWNKTCDSTSPPKMNLVHKRDVWEYHVTHSSALSPYSSFWSLAWHSCTENQNKGFNFVWKSLTKDLATMPRLCPFPTVFHKGGYTNVKYNLIKLQCLSSTNIVYDFTILIMTKHNFHKLQYIGSNCNCQ